MYCWVSSSALVIFFFNSSCQAAEPQCKQKINFIPMLCWCPCVELNLSLKHLSASFPETLSASGLCCEQGEAKSAELIGQAIANNPAFLALRQIEAAREISHTISASANKVFLDSNDLLLNLQQLNVSSKQKKWCHNVIPFLLSLQSVVDAFVPDIVRNARFWM